MIWLLTLASLSSFSDRLALLVRFVLRLMCSLFIPLCSHDALQSVSGVFVSCVSWKGFLSPAGLQLTPLLTDARLFSISIVPHDRMCPTPEKQKLSAGFDSLGPIFCTDEKKKSVSPAVTWETYSRPRGRNFNENFFFKKTKKNKVAARFSRVLLPVESPLSATVVTKEGVRRNSTKRSAALTLVLLQYYSLFSRTSQEGQL